MLKHTVLSLLLSVVLLASSACTTQLEDNIPSVTYDFDSIGLYLARGSLTKTDFEQYKVFSKNLFFECGEIKGGENIPAQQAPALLTPTQQKKIQGTATALCEVLENSNFTFAKQDPKHGIANSGQLILDLSVNGKEYKIKTSVDSISNSKSLQEKKLRRLVEAIRGSTKTPPCGLKEFYGLGSSTN